MGKDSRQIAADRRQLVEVRDQTSEVGVKLTSDLRLLTSMIDDLYGLNDLNDFNAFNDSLLTAHPLVLTPET